MPVNGRVEWLRWVVPPGATAMHFPAAGQARVFVNGNETHAEGDRWVLDDPASLRRICTARIVPGRGHTEGALLDGPVTYEVGPGRMTLGNWSDHGLEAWSGGVWYRKSFWLDSLPTGEVVLDLGRVRGTAEIRVNGQPAGTRIWSPYRVDVTGLLRGGDNNIEILVLNTLGPYLWGHSATHFVFPGQEQSGIFGPVRLLT